MADPTPSAGHAAEGTPAAGPLAGSAASADALELESMGFPAASARAALLLHPSLADATTFLLNDETHTRRYIDAYEFLAALGFPPPLIRLGLERTKGNGEQAMEWILGADDREKRKSDSAAAAAGTPAEPVPLVTAQYSDEQVRADLLVHRAVFARDTRALGEYCKRGLQNGRDHHGRTPLLLAHHLGLADVVTFLLNRGADPRLKMPRGWSLLQQACLQGQRALALDVYLHTLMLKQAEWEHAQKNLLASLQRMADFTMSIDWEIKSWVPLVGRLAPKDSFSIWKKGGLLRLDSNVRGVSGLQVHRGLLSYIFTRGSVWLVDHVSRTYADALADFRQPNYDDVQQHVAWLMSKEAASRSEINTERVEFRSAKTLMRGQKYEQVERYRCKVVHMTGLRFVEIKSKDSKADNAAPVEEGPPAAAAAAGSSLPAGAASSSSPSVAGSSALSNLDAGSYFTPSALSAYNRQRRRQERRERKMHRRLDAAFEELEAKQSSAAGSQASASGDPAPSSSSSGAASSSSSAPSASAVTGSRRVSASSAHPSDDEASEEEKDGASSAAASSAAGGSAAALDDAAAADDGIQLKTTSVDATLCLTPDFPLPLSHLLILLDLLSPASSHLAKLRDILAVQLPTDDSAGGGGGGGGGGGAPFPVRLTFPVVSQVNACVTFGKFEPATESGPTAIRDDVFALPSDFVERAR